MHFKTAVPNVALAKEGDLYCSDSCRNSVTRKILRIMKLTAILLTIVCLTTSAAGYSQRVTLTVKDAPLEKVFRQIQKQTGYDFLFTRQMLQDSKPVSLQVKDASLNEVLQLCLKDQPLSFTIENNAIVINRKTLSADIGLPASDLPPPPIDVKGKVVNEKGEAVIATVTVKGTKTAVSTDANGEFIIRNVDENATLVISGVSIETIEVKVGGKTDLATITTKAKVVEGANVTIANTGYQKVKPNEVNGSISVIDNKTLNLQTGTNIIDRLNGVTPGMIFLTNKLLPGQSVKYTIRGLSTIKGEYAPLIVVDNLPYRGDIQNISPDDVENITVLKDASATSIYGAQGANGVIVITTKSGKYNQKTKVNFFYNLTIIPKPDLYQTDQISSETYIDIEQFLFQQGYFSNAISNNYTPLTSAVEIFLKRSQGKISPFDSTNQINALKRNDYRKDLDKYLYQTGLLSQYTLSCNGGGNNIAWYLSANFNKRRDNLDNAEDRYMINFRNSYKPIKNLELSANLTYANSKTVSGKEVPALFRKAPYTEFVDEQGVPLPVSKLRSAYLDTAGGGMLLDWRYYPLDDYRHNDNINETQSIQLALNASWQIVKNIRISANYGLLKSWNKSEQYYDAQSYYSRDLINRFTNLNTTPSKMYPIPRGPISTRSFFNTGSEDFRIDISASKVMGQHALNGLAGFGMTETITKPGLRTTLYNYDRVAGTNTPVDFITEFPQFNSLSGPTRIPGAATTEAVQIRELVNVFGLVSYTYKGRYSVSGSMRKDASNIFGVSTNDKWKPFWSAGLGWQISKEPFYNYAAIPNLSLNATWGFSGNVSPEKTALPTTNSGGSNGFGLPMAVITTPNNPNLRWERSRQMNIALSFGFRKYINGSLQFYEKNNTDLFGATFSDYTNGFWQSNKNSAHTKGQGIEFTLNFARSFRKLKWDAGIIYNYQVDKLISYDATDLVGTSDGNSLIQNPNIGKPLFSIVAYRWAGLNSSGMPQGYLNGIPSTNYVGIFGDLDKNGFNGPVKYIGRSIAPHFGSLTNSLSWKNFSFSFLITYQFGHYFKKPSFSSADLINSTVIHTDYYKRWQKPGDELITDIPAFFYPAISSLDLFYERSEVNFVKADYIKLQALNLGYSIDPPKKTGFDDLRIRIGVSNSSGGFIWVANKQKLNPDAPLQKATFFNRATFTFSLNANF